MKLKIKVKVLTPGCEPVITEKGDWIDLRAAEAVNIPNPWAGKMNGNAPRDVNFNNYMIPLGVAMKLPDGFEAVVAPRSSMWKWFKAVLPNSIGIIDQEYSSNKDQWFANFISLGKTNINQFDRICQFRIQLSQKATFWQKLRWLFSSGVKIVYVSDLGDKARGGFGSTGVN